MTARSLALGLDGADLELILELGKEQLPTLHRLMSEGSFAALESVMPPATLPNWSTFLTGVNPGRHGVFDFTTREGSRVKFTGGTVRETPTIAHQLDQLGFACAVVGFPGTWPPEPLQRGIFISGWDSPVAFEGNPSFVHPPSLHRDIVQQFGKIRFDDVDEFSADKPRWHDGLAGALEQRIARKTELASWLLGQRSWDLFAFYFGESDTASHHLWSLHDSGSPRNLDGEARDGLGRVYRALDRAVATLLEQAGEAVELTVVSDHGSGGSSDKVLYLNRVLADAGLLTFDDRALRRLASGGFQGIKNLALTRFPAGVREQLFRLGASVLPGLLESKARFGAIDFAQTRAFSDELNYFPAIHLNLRGREPNGVVAEQDRESTAMEVEAALRSLTDPWTGKPVVRRVMRREELFEGPFVFRAPDLLLDLNLDEGYSYNLMPTASAPQGTGPWRRLDRSEYLGRKGRSLPGSHRPFGYYLAHGPSVMAAGRTEAAIADATATLLARMGVENVPDSAGRVLFEILEDAARPQRAHAQEEAGRGPQHSKLTRSGKFLQPGHLERRLRSLGYIE